ncbi:heparinase II/III family protein [Sphingomonas morindae]|uniref:Heparinase II/III family protein n=1 Tax=Sphingomonas morindae TaxID=1541170 RepID=A0ABY4XC82_9SPHN|nr:heparinase II/III family protein [Sphingomonas morindae]USI74285.1 heparinase II/III family protein [Sphingomonas morindae]
MSGARRAAPEEPAETPVAPGRSLIRVADERGASLAERLMAQLERLAWKTPFHSMRLRGRYPLKLLGVPRDPIAGDAEAGLDLLDGEVTLGRARADADTLDYADARHGQGFVDHVQSFAWLRDLAAAAPRETGAPVAEALMRRWLDAHGAVIAEPAWRADLWGRRILAWTAHAPLILSSSDLVYRSAVLNTLARGARHLDQTAEKAPVGLPRIAAAAGLIAAGLLIPGGEPRLARGEAAMAKALATGATGDGGIVSRAPVDLLALVELLAQLLAVYEERRREPPAALPATLARAVPALLGVTLGDGRLSSWQGGGPLEADRVARAIAGSGVRTRPQRQSREWGFQRLAGGATVLVADCAPPPASRLARGGCASTLAFEFADGSQRIIVNCGGDRPWSALPREIGEALRTTAAHSTLTLADSNSTAIHPDGSLGRGVTEVELDRQEQESASRIEASHDGYVRRYGLIHRRRLALAADGRELAGEDVLLPAGGGRGAATVGFAARFHLAPGVEATATADGQGALLRLEGGGLWQFRCRGGTLALEESIWIDGRGRPAHASQLVVSGQAPAGGTSISWIIKRAG